MLKLNKFFILILFFLRINIAYDNLDNRNNLLANTKELFDNIEKINDQFNYYDWYSFLKNLSLTKEQINILKNLSLTKEQINILKDSYNIDILSKKLSDRSLKNLKKELLFIIDNFFENEFDEKNLTNYHLYLVFFKKSEDFSVLERLEIFRLIIIKHNPLIYFKKQYNFYKINKNLDKIIKLKKQLF